MASISKTDAAHATLTGVTVDTVTITNEYEACEVANRTGSTTLWFTIAGVADAAPAVPTVAGDNTQFVTAASSLTVSVPNWNTSNGFVVKILGNGNDYSVSGVDQ